jgi:septal ring factor EnvC (AmiA/AmiB activator)
MTELDTRAAETATPAAPTDEGDKRGRATWAMVEEANERAAAAELERDQVADELDDLRRELARVRGAIARTAVDAGVGFGDVIEAYGGTAPALPAGS